MLFRSMNNHLQCCFFWILRRPSPLRGHSSNGSITYISTLCQTRPTSNECGLVVNSAIRVCIIPGVTHAIRVGFSSLWSFANIIIRPFAFLHSPGPPGGCSHAAVACVSTMRSRGRSRGLLSSNGRFSIDMPTIAIFENICGVTTGELCAKIS